MIKSIAGNI